MKHLILTIWQFYRDGFRSMKLGRTLWLIILIKLFIMFFILRLFFFPNYLNQEAGDGGKDGYVSRELIERVPVGHSHADEVAVFWGKSLQELAQIWLFSRSGPEQPGFRCYLQDFHFCFVGNSCFYVG